MDYRTRSFWQLIIDLLALAGLLAIAFAASPTRAGINESHFSPIPVIRIDAIHFAMPSWNQDS